MRLQDKSNFLVLNIFTKCFSGTRVGQIRTKCLNSYLIFSICYFQLRIKCFQNFLLDKEMNNAVNRCCQIFWYLFASFKNLVFCSLYTVIRESPCRVISWITIYSWITIWVSSPRIVKFEWRRITKSNPGKVSETTRRETFPIYIATWKINQCD